MYASEFQKYPLLKNCKKFIWSEKLKSGTDSYEL